MQIKKQIKPAQAQIGQKLAHDVWDAHGLCLFGENVVLNATMLNHLRECDLEFISVWDEQSLDENEVTKRTLEITEQLAQRFRQVQDNAPMRRLHDILLAYRLKPFEHAASQDKPTA